MKDEYIRKQDAVDMCGGYGCLAHFMSTIKPADVAPVRHGHWEYIDDTYCGFEDTDVRCSVCKTTININRFRKTKWCPDCGAKMDGERREE